MKLYITLSLGLVVAVIAISLFAPWRTINSDETDVLAIYEVNLEDDICRGPYPGYPSCAKNVADLMYRWNRTTESEQYYRERGFDGTYCSALDYLNSNGFTCPEHADLIAPKIRGVNLGGWLVLEPWITPSLFEQFDPADNVRDQWTFCQKLGKEEALKQLKNHWDTWVTEQDLANLAVSGITHLRIPVGYWLMDDIAANEPYVDGDLYYLLRALGWAKKYGLHAIIDMHAVPGSQNGFDNSGKQGDIHWADAQQADDGAVLYPNIERTLVIWRHLAAKLTGTDQLFEYSGVVTGIELVNEAFITIPINVVQRYYILGYETVKQFDNDFSVIIGDSFRFNEWNDFMYPPHFKHVWIDTHIYQVFDMYFLSMTPDDHIQHTCEVDKEAVSVAPLSVMVGEWSLATTDCAQWLNGYMKPSRYEGKFPGSRYIGTCEGRDNPTTFTQEYREFLKKYAEAQMQAYETGSASGWFFWNFKTERAPQWNYLLGLQEGWLPRNQSNRNTVCF